MPINTQLTGAAISAHRQRMNLSQQGLAGLMNVTHQAVSKWEKGLALPDTETLLALSKLFGTSMEDLLMGRMPAAEPVESAASAQPENLYAESENESSLKRNDAIDFATIINMLPFVSAEAADRLFLACTQSNQLDAGQLMALVPFISQSTLAEYVSKHPLGESSPEVISSLAPFLPTSAVDEMLLGMKRPIPKHVLNMILPFASSDVLEKVMMESLGVQADAMPSTDAAVSEEKTAKPFGLRIQERIHRRIQHKLDKLGIAPSDHPLSANARRGAANAVSAIAGDRRESPRMRLIRRAIETGDEEMIIELVDELGSSEMQSVISLLVEKNMVGLLAEVFDELDDENRRMLLTELTETGDAELLKLFCDVADELDPDMQSVLIQLLLKGRLYDELADIVDVLDEDAKHELLDKAFEINDSQLLRLISEHLS
ncbi:MAG: helix-turn-helix domain-containing protein [Clostridia bacterium]|nr:helix-turn-helix domain-containing protein [Clostridia bacterium]